MGRSSRQWSSVGQQVVRQWVVVVQRVVVVVQRVVVVVQRVVVVVVGSSSWSASGGA